MSPDAKNGRDMRKVYNEQAEDFATKAPTLLTWEYIGKPALERNLSKFFTNGRNTKVLDVGSASGRVVEFMVKNGIPAENITGVEISPNEAEIARKNVPGTTFEVGDIRSARLKPEAYNLVTCNMVLEFLDEKGLDRALRNIYGSMKPGATFIYISTHPGRVENKYGLDRSHEGWFDTGGPWGGSFQNWHRSIASYIQQTVDAGFRILTKEEIEMPQDIQKNHPEFKSFGAPARLVVVAQKPAR